MAKRKTRKELLEGTEYGTGSKSPSKKNKRKTRKELLEGTEYGTGKKNNKKLRQPTLSERFALKTFQDISPEKIGPYMEKRGIDPDFDEGTTWEDFTVDILGDIGTGAASTVGAGMGAGLGLPGMLGGSFAGGTLARTAIGAGGRALGMELAPDDLGETAKGIATQEALGTALFGGGPAKGLVQYGGGKVLKGGASLLRAGANKVPPALKEWLKDSFEPFLERAMGIKEGIGHGVDRIAKGWKTYPKEKRNRLLKSIKDRSFDPSDGNKGTRNMARAIYGSVEDMNPNKLVNFYKHAKRSIGENNERLGKALRKNNNYDTDFVGGNPEKHMNLNKLGLTDKKFNDLNAGGLNDGPMKKQLSALLEDNVKKSRKAYVNKSINDGNIINEYNRALRNAEKLDAAEVANMAKNTPMKLKQSAQSPISHVDKAHLKYGTLLKDIREEAKNAVNYQNVPMDATQVHKVYTILQDTSPSVSGVGLDRNPVKVLADNVRSRLINDSKNPTAMGSSMNNYADAVRHKKALEGFNNGKPWTRTIKKGDKQINVLNDEVGLGEKVKEAVDKGYSTPGSSNIVDTINQAENFYNNPRKSGLTPSVKKSVHPPKTSATMATGIHLDPKKEKPIYLITDPSNPKERLGKDTAALEAAFDPDLDTSVAFSGVHPSKAGILDKTARSFARPLYNTSRYLRKGEDYVPVGEPNFLLKSMEDWGEKKGKTKLKIPEVPWVRNRTSGLIGGGALGLGSTLVTGLDPWNSTMVGAGLGATGIRPGTVMRKWGKFGQKYARKGANVLDAAAKPLDKGAKGVAQDFFGPTTAKFIPRGTGKETLKSILLRDQE